MSLPDWAGATVVILASGPSLTIEQCETVKRWRDYQHEDTGPRFVIAINTTFRRAPWADMLYACDGTWWRVYHAEVQQVFHGELWTQDRLAFEEFKVNRIESVRNPGLGKRPGVIHQGGNGGYQAINIAYQAGAKRIVLLGFDMQGDHWHGKHPQGLPNTQVWLFERWIEDFKSLAKDLKAEGISVINCSTNSALGAFKKADLRVALEENDESHASHPQGSLVSAGGV